MGQIVQQVPEGKSTRYVIRIAEELSRYVAHKGSVCVDGVSLTVNAVEGNEFSLQIIPHTEQETIFSEYSVGTEVNIEVDIIARYLERLLGKTDEPAGLTMEQIVKAGFK